MSGIIAGTSTITSDPTCVAGATASVRQLVNIVDNRFGLFMPDYAIKLQSAYGKLQEDTNVAYVYCNLEQWYANAALLFDASSSSAYQKLFIRVTTSMVNDWWYKTMCVVDGIFGLNYYDVGFCLGQLVIIVLDVSLG